MIDSVCDLIVRRVNPGSHSTPRHFYNKVSLKRGDAPLYKQTILNTDEGNLKFLDLRKIKDNINSLYIYILMFNF